MTELRRLAPIDRPWRQIAATSLSLTVAASALAGGGWKLEVLPLVGAAALVAFGATAVGRAEPHVTGIRIPGLAIAIAVFAMLTLVQAVWMPQSWLAAVSPKASELRSFVVGDGAGPISYEAAATLREFAKLLIYAMVVVTGSALSARQADRKSVVQTIVVVGLASAAVAVVHRLLGVERLFGLLETQAPTTEMLTTFVNPNHASGFMVLCAACAVGLADHVNDRAERIGWRLAALVCSAVAVLLLSKGGLAGLALAMLLYGAIRRWGLRWSLRAMAALGLVVAGSIVVVVWTLPAVWLETARSLGVREKIAGVRDVVPLIADHPVVGIGRGSFVSVYPHYKTSPLQLTFAFPENLAAQLLAEWGVVVGVIAILSLAWVILRRLRSRDPLRLGAMAGVAAVVAQNAADFSLELTGVAVPVAAILGLTTPPEATRGFKVSRYALVPALLVLVAFVFGSIGLAYRNGDLDRDLKRLQQMILRARAGEMVQEDAHEIWTRHPANPVASARVAFLHEVAKPPDYAAALRAANRTLYLAPKYADGYVLAGRLLMRMGFRQQGLLSIRRGWAMASGRPELMRHVLSLCRDADEVWALLPRADVVTDRPDGRAVRMAAVWLQDIGRVQLAKELLERPYPDEDAVDEELAALVAARKSLGLFESSLRALRLRQKARPDDLELYALEARILHATGRSGEALDVLARIESVRDARVQRLVFDASMAVGDIDRAASALGRLESAAGKGDWTLALRRARLEIRRGDKVKAIEVLDRTIERSPWRLNLRIERARLLIDQGLTAQAKHDVLIVLRRQPDHPEARRLAAKLALSVQDDPTP